MCEGKKHYFVFSLKLDDPDTGYFFCVCGQTKVWTEDFHGAPKV